MGFQVFYSKWVLGLSFDIRILYLIVHDDGDSEDLDGYECFAAMEQYRKNFSTFNSNSPFARHLESKVVTVKRLLYFNLSILFNLSRYLEMEVAGLQHLPVRGISKKDLSKSIYNSYNNCISKNSSLT